MSNKNRKLHTAEFVGALKAELAQLKQERDRLQESLLDVSKKATAEIDSLRKALQEKTGAPF